MAIFKSQHEKKDKEFLEIPINELNVDRYQRPVKAKSVQKMIKTYDPDIVMVGLVSYRDGAFYLLDGQHRVEMLKAVGEKTFLCQVLRDLTYEEESAKFTELNTQRNGLSAQDIFVANVESKKEKALEVLKIIKECGFEFQRGINNKSGHVTCIKTCIDVFEQYGEAVLRKTLLTLMAVWEGRNQSVNSRMIHGLAKFVSVYGAQCNFERLVSRLRSYSPEQVLLEAKYQTSQGGIKSLRHGTVVARVIRSVYNMGKTGGSLSTNLL